MHPNYFYFILYKPLGNKTNHNLNHSRPDSYSGRPHIYDLLQIFSPSHPRFERPINVWGQPLGAGFQRVGELSKPYSDQKQQRAKLKERLREKSWFIVNCSLPGVVSRADCQGSTFHLPDMIEASGCVTKVCVCVCMRVCVGWGGECLRQLCSWDSPARGGKSICLLSKKEFQCVWDR